jgi:hypothetical protein
MNAGVPCVGALSSGTLTKSDIASPSSKLHTISHISGMQMSSTSAKGGLSTQVPMMSLRSSNNNNFKNFVLKNLIFLLLPPLLCWGRIAFG